MLDPHVLDVDPGLAGRIEDPGQLAWLDYGCVRAEGMGISPGRVINTHGAAGLASAARH